MEPQSGIKAWQWVVTVIVIVVLIIIGVKVFGGKKAEAPATNETPATTETATTGLNRIVMSDQYPGNIVYLSSVQLENPGWVAVHKDNNGQPGDVIGSMWFDKGINPGKLTLSQSTVEGGTYYAVIHSDDGNKLFDATKDMPLKDSNGSVIMKIFHASAAVGADFKG